MFRKRIFQVISLILAVLFVGSLIFTLVYYGLN